MSRKKHRCQGQISLFPTPSLPERSILEQCLYQSLHSTAGAKERWEKIRALQPTDAQGGNAEFGQNSTLRLKASD
jgi:hypothetical protein